MNNSEPLNIDGYSSNVYIRKNICQEQKESLVEAILRMGFWMDPTERWWFL